MNLTLLHPRIHIRILDHPSSDRLVAFAAAVAAVVVAVVVVAALAVSVVLPLLASA